ncbi:PREDICTED: F-actin-uncapping protein LRRC16A-like, partial [Amphimedon queenslandica]
MKQNQDLLYSLTHLDLSENPLGPESQGPLVFLKEPQTVTTLNLSKCGLNFELVFPILLRGCQQHLRDLDLSQNRINVKKLNVTSLGQIMQQFFSSAISLQVINLSDCKLTPDLAIAIMEGLSVNPNISDTTLNLSSNELGHGLDVRSMSDSLSRLKKVNTLNISNTNIDQDLSRLIEALGLNRSIKHLSIGQNFEGRERIEGVKQLCRMIKADDCCLESLDISDSKLKEVTSAILNSLIYNDSIVKLDISGNGMGTHGLRAMVKLLLSGTQLKYVTHTIQTQ